MIKRFENLNQETYCDIRTLEEKCVAADQTSLKLELEYKLAGKSTATGRYNEFLYYQDEELIGYMGICDFGGSELEVNGMVHPSHRRQDIFTKLFGEVKKEWQRRDADRLLLLTDNASESGQGFIESVGARYDSSEYEMHLKHPPATDVARIRLVRATNADAREIVRQDRIYFEDVHSEDKELPMKLPEEEEKRGMIIYLVYSGPTVVGKVNLAIEGVMGSIYGLGVLPEYRRQGYGRQILLASINILIQKQCDDIMLQVATENANALNLYLDVGFRQTSIMDYYLINK